MVVAGDDDEEAAPFGQPLYDEDDDAEAAPFGQSLQTDSDVVMVRRMVMLHHRHATLFRAVPSAEATGGRSRESLLLLLRLILDRTVVNRLTLPRRV